MSTAFSQLDNLYHQQLADRLWSRERPLCQSALVDSLMEETITNADGRAHHWSWDDVENLYVDPSEWCVDQCRQWLVMFTDDPCMDLESTDVEYLRDQVRDFSGPAEILEWWAVSHWFAGKLRDQGECVLENDYGIWWGRQCSGQSVVLDDCIQRIAFDVLGNES